jgi:hypothetical protein
MHPTTSTTISIMKKSAEGGEGIRKAEDYLKYFTVKNLEQLQSHEVNRPQSVRFAQKRNPYAVDNPEEEDDSDSLERA